MFGIKFAPLNVPLERRLQTVANFFCIWLFLSSWIGGVVLLGCLLFSKYYWITLCYTAWYIWDFDQPNCGGRRCNFLRHLSIFKLWSAYFPASLTKVAELSPGKNYILAYHPHGAYVVGALTSFCSEGTGFSELFPEIVIHQLTTRLYYVFPIFREILMGFGASNASERNIRHITRTGTGNAIALAVGGMMEVLDATPGSTRLVLKDRKGFIRVAIRTGSDLVPVYGFGENELFRQLIPNPPGSQVRNFQRWMQKTTGLPSFVYGRGIFNYSIGNLPHRHPINVVVGAPISVVQDNNPSEMQVDALHRKYQDALTELFDTHKERNGCADKRLEFI